MTPQASALTALFISGLLGSLGHCLGMCGPLVIMVGLQIGAVKRRQWPSHLLYHGGRIAVYALLGAAAGGLGSFIGLAERLSSLAGALGLGLGVGVALLGVSYLGWLPLARLEGGSGWIAGAMQWALGRGAAGIALLGALSGLLPCCLLYSALLVAGSTAGAISGALGMALFGLGTLPVLLLAGLGAWRLSLPVRRLINRAMGFLMVLVGLHLAVRGLAELHLLPHLQLGRLVLW